MLSRLHGVHRLVATLLFGTAMHIMECLRLRVRDISLAKNEILVRDVRNELVKRIGIPPHLLLAIKAQLQKVLEDHADDMKSDWQGVYIPEPLLMEYPNVSKMLSWQYVFAAKRLPHDPSDGKIRRYHLDEREFQRALADAASEAGIDKPMGSHGLGMIMAGIRHAAKSKAR
jgi:integrase